MAVGEKAPDGAGTAGDGEGAVRPGRPFWRELPMMLVLALVLALVVKTFVAQAFLIPSDSMRDTLRRGDRVVVDKLTSWSGAEPRRGEVVVFHDPADWLHGQPTAQPNLAQHVLITIGLMPSANERVLVKRTIAIGGDTVQCKKGGPVVVNGEELYEPYIRPGDTACDDAPFGPLTVPEGTIWVMGDHRQNSRDSRYHADGHTRGFVPVDDVVGRAVVIAWPVGRWSTLPDGFDPPVSDSR
ncbi:signal peptidase I [Streptomyces sp. NPDC058622]|uniref:signal peptidase I n=1 Tax=Streptomyces sp. NPDC058622 TaxID=3346562 RepID=UPI003660B275